MATPEVAILLVGLHDEPDPPAGQLGPYGGWVWFGEWDMGRAVADRVRIEPDYGKAFDAGARLLQFRRDALPTSTWEHAQKQLTAALWPPRKKKKGNTAIDEEAVDERKTGSLPSSKRYRPPGGLEIIECPVARTAVSYERKLLRFLSPSPDETRAGDVLYSVRWMARSYIADIECDVRAGNQQFVRGASAIVDDLSVRWARGDRQTHESKLLAAMARLVEQTEAAVAFGRLACLKTLGSNERNILVSLSEHNAFERAARKTSTELAVLVFGAKRRDEGSTSHDTKIRIAAGALMERGMVQSSTKPGGYWLTPWGREVAALDKDLDRRAALL